MLFVQVLEKFYKKILYVDTLHAYKVKVFYYA